MKTLTTEQSIELLKRIGNATYRPLDEDEQEIFGGASDSARMASFQGAEYPLEYSVVIDGPRVEIHQIDIDTGADGNYTHFELDF